MSDTLNISLIQFDIAWESPNDNFIRIENLLNTNSFNSQLIVLPEMFNTGFSMKPSKIASSMNGEAVVWMQSLAKNKNATIIGSLAIVENNKYYNRLMAVNPNGDLNFYNKRHLFRMAGENKVYSMGNTQVVINVNQWRVALFVCYDLRFPVWCRNKNDYDLAVFVANWPAQRNLAWNTLLKARAIENQSYVIGVNRVGNDAAIDYCGNSLIVNFDGNINAHAPDNIEAVINSSINLSKLKKYRNEFPAWRDADDFDITL